MRSASRESGLNRLVFIAPSNVIICYYAGRVGSSIISAMRRGVLVSYFSLPIRDLSYIFEKKGGGG